MFGSSLTKELKENGAEITVTNDNRQVRDLSVTANSFEKDID